MNRMRHLVAVTCAAMPVPVIVLGALVLARWPVPSILFTVIAATLATLMVAVMLHHLIVSRLLDPIDDLNARIFRGETISSDRLAALAHHIRQRVSKEAAASAGTPTAPVSPERVAPEGSTRPTIADSDRQLLAGLQSTASLLTVMLNTISTSPAPAMQRFAQRLELLTDELLATPYAIDYEEPTDLREAVDRAVDALHACGYGCVTPVFSETGQLRVNTNPGILTALVFNYLKSLAPASGYLHIRCSSNSVKCSATTWRDQSPDARCTMLMDMLGAVSERDVLTLPLAVETTGVPTIGAVRIVASTDSERRALASRMASIGFSEEADTKSAAICITTVSDTATLKTLLDECGHVIVIDRGVRVPGARYLNAPVMQSELEQMIAVIRRQTAENAPRRVLAVDDDERMLKQLGETCRLTGISLDTALTAAQAQAALACTDYDAVFVDLNLGEEDGIAIAALLTAETAAPVFLLTANAGEDERNRAALAGVRDTLIKPMEPDTLQALLADAPRPPVPATGQDVPRFDPALALRLAHYQPEVAREMVGALITSIPADVEDIRRALENGSLDRVRELAHRFSGALQYCGVPRLRNASHTLESAARDEGQQEVRLAFLVFENEAYALLDIWHASSDFFETSVIRRAD